MSKGSVSLVEVVELLIERSCLESYLETQKRRRGVTARSRPPLHRDESEVASNWTIDHRRPANLILLNTVRSDA